MHGFGSFADFLGAPPGPCTGDPMRQFLDGLSDMRDQVVEKWLTQHKGHLAYLRIETWRYPKDGREPVWVKCTQCKKVLRVNVEWDLASPDPKAARIVAEEVGQDGPEKQTPRAKVEWSVNPDLRRALPTDDI